jgi:hypothetical protein
VHPDGRKNTVGGEPAKGHKGAASPAIHPTAPLAALVAPTIARDALCASHVLGDGLEGTRWGTKDFYVEDPDGYIICFGGRPTAG